MGSTFSLSNKTRRNLPRVPFRLIKESILGKEYDLSVALVPPAQMRSITLKTKNKDKVSNVLSFPLTENSGEILICPTAAAPYTVGYLFIHGCLHLKGHKHSDTMERIEHALLKRFELCKKSSQESTSARTRSR
ncbi:MAG TPA: rRNA maturation RNAse YbeY [Candidatus Paceibacterota bacterium]|nr:rRNA maturation RNAse YbeY [Candidatus Paceibacterota bacterium]